MVAASARPMPARRKDVATILSTQRDLELIAFFCHGLRRSLQTGHDLGTVNELADAIAAASGPRVTVALYACSTAHELTVTRGGFADALRDALTARGKAGHVDAHTTAGHATTNPMVQRFDMQANVGDITAPWIVEPRTELWAGWQRALRGPLRLEFPLLDAEAINVAPLNNVPGAVVSLMERSNVETVIVAGKVRKWKGRLLDVNLDKLRRELEASRDRVFSAAGIEQDLFRRF